MDLLNMHERGQNGLLFTSMTEEIRGYKHKAHEICRAYNKLASEDPNREKLLQDLFRKIGSHAEIDGALQVNFGIHTEIGDGFRAGYGFTLLDNGPVRIGDGCTFSGKVSVMASSHPLIWKEREAMTYPDGTVSVSEFAPPIVIGNRVRIGCGAIICAGVTVGDDAVIAPGSVVVKDVPKGAFVSGIPAKVQNSGKEAEGNA